MAELFYLQRTNYDYSSSFGSLALGSTAFGSAAFTSPAFGSPFCSSCCNFCLISAKSTKITKSSFFNFTLDVLHGLSWLYQLQLLLLFCAASFSSNFACSQIRV